MKRFTDSPYEKMMQEIPRPGKPGPMAKPPAESPCHGCGYWRGMPCVGNCWRELMAPRSCGQNVHNSPGA
ncbi:MAG: hypothetical protein LUG13_06235 [Oscillospiraceae bacterium]|nr:hypothetical protein [Oscillospiraceae bacterium]